MRREDDAARTGQCVNRGALGPAELAEDDGFEEQWGQFVYTNPGVEQRIAGTCRPYSNVDVYITTNADPNLTGATVNIYGVVHNGLVLLSTRNLAAQAGTQRFTASGACDGFEVTVTGASATAVPSFVTMVAYGWEGSCCGGGGGGGAFPNVQVFNDASAPLVPSVDHSLTAVMLGMTANRTTTLPANPEVGQDVVAVDGDGSLGSFNWTLDGNGNNINGAATFVLAATTIGASSGGGVGPRGAVTLRFISKAIGWLVIG